MTAKFVTEVTVIDPDTNLPVAMSVYKHENGGMFSVDSSYVEQVLPEEGNAYINDPLEPDDTVELIEEVEPETKEAKFFLSSLSEIKGSVLDYVYPDMKQRGVTMTFKERLGTKHGECPECGHKKWWLIPLELNPNYGGKQWIECMNPLCGYRTHL